MGYQARLRKIISVSLKNVSPTKVMCERSVRLEDIEFSNMVEMEGGFSGAKVLAFSPDPMCKAVQEGFLDPDKKYIIKVMDNETVHRGLQEGLLRNANNPIRLRIEAAESFILK